MILYAKTETMLRQNFTRADGLDFELIKAGRHTLLWKVSKEGKTIRYEAWNTFRGANGEDFDESDNRPFGNLKSVEDYFNKQENNID